LIMCIELLVDRAQVRLDRAGRQVELSRDRLTRAEVGEGADDDQLPRGECRRVRRRGLGDKRPRERECGTELSGGAECLEDPRALWVRQERESDLQAVSAGEEEQPARRISDNLGILAGDTETSEHREDEVLLERSVRARRALAQLGRGVLEFAVVDVAASAERERDRILGGARTGRCEQSRVLSEQHEQCAYVAGAPGRGRAGRVSTARTDG